MAQAQVLVVDPNPTTLQRVQAALRGTPYGILAARDAIEAESFTDGLQIALVLSSTSLPRGNGYDLARTLLATHPDAKVFLVSGPFEVYNRERAEQAGVFGRISRPFSADGLRARLEQVLGPLPALVEDETPLVEGPAPPSPAADPLPIGLYADPGRPPSPRDDGPQDVTPDELLLTPLEPPENTDPVAITFPELTQPAAGYRPPVSAERVATILPRGYDQLPAPGASIEALSPALERAVMEVLPEVVEVVLRQALQSSPAFRELVAVAVDEAVRAHVGALIAERVKESEGS